MAARKQANLQRVDKVVAGLARRNEKFRELANGFVVKDNHRYCRASVLAKFLGYKTSATFEACIHRAQITAANSGMSISEHFIESTVFDDESDTLLSEWAAYATVMEADTKLKTVALAKSFFAALAEKEARHQEDRLRERQAFKTLNKRLHGAAKQAGIEQSRDHAIFEDNGYKGMYGASLREVERMKGVPADERLVDRADHTELAANNLRMSLTADKIFSEKIKVKARANDIHNSMGKIVRTAVMDGTGKAPEQLPLAPVHINLLTKEKAKELRQGGL